MPCRFLNHKFEQQSRQIQRQHKRIIAYTISKYTRLSEEPMVQRPIRGRTNPSSKHLRDSQFIFPECLGLFFSTPGRLVLGILSNTVLGSLLPS